MRRSERTMMCDTEEMTLSTTACNNWKGSMVYTVKMMKRKKGTWGENADKYLQIKHTW